MKNDNALDFKELLKKYGYTQKKFSDDFNIPLRTVGDWCTKKRTPPIYVYELILFKLENEKKPTN